MSTYSSDQVPDRVSLNNLLDGLLNVHLQDLGGDLALGVQVVLPFLKPEQSPTLGPALANGHTQAPDVCLKTVAGILPHLDVRWILVEPPGYLWGKVGHCSGRIASFQRAGWKGGIERVKPGLREAVVTDDEVSRGRDEDI